MPLCRRWLLTLAAALAASLAAAGCDYTATGGGGDDYRPIVKDPLAPRPLDENDNVISSAPRALPRGVPTRIEMSAAEWRRRQAEEQQARELEAQRKAEEARQAEQARLEQEAQLAALRAQAQAEAQAEAEAQPEGGEAQAGEAAPPSAAADDADADQDAAPPAAVAAADAAAADPAADAVEWIDPAPTPTESAAPAPAAAAAPERAAATPELVQQAPTPAAATATQPPPPRPPTATAAASAAARDTQPQPQPQVDPLLQAVESAVGIDPQPAALPPARVAAPSPAPATAGAEAQARTRPDYLIDYDRFSRQIAEAPSAAVRLDLLQKRWESVRLAVAHCSVAIGSGGDFSASTELWHRPIIASAWSVSESGDLTKAVDSGSHASVLVQGDCRAPVQIKENALVHIFGNLESRILLKGPAEVVIGGDIAEGGQIISDNSLKLFVGGNVHGAISSTRSATIWVSGSYLGDLGTGSPSTRLTVVGDMFGQVRPLGEAALFTLEVRSFMPAQSLSAIAEHAYMSFQATIFSSDQPPGIYPRSDDPRPGQGRWVIHQEAIDPRTARESRVQTP